MVQGPMSTHTMEQIISCDMSRHLFPEEHTFLAFVDNTVPERLLFSPIVVTLLVQDLVTHCVNAATGSVHIWDLEEVIKLSSEQDRNNAEVYATAFYPELGYCHHRGDDRIAPDGCCHPGSNNKQQSLWLHSGADPAETQVVLHMQECSARESVCAQHRKQQPDVRRFL
jgi:hypothetical protein